MSKAKVIFYKKTREKKKTSITTALHGGTEVPNKLLELMEKFESFDDYDAESRNIIFAYHDYAQWDNEQTKNLKNSEVDFLYEVYLNEDGILFSFSKLGKSFCKKVTLEEFKKLIKE